MTARTDCVSKKPWKTKYATHLNAPIKSDTEVNLSTPSQWTSLATNYTVATMSSNSLETYTLARKSRSMIIKTGQRTIHFGVNKQAVMSH